MASLGRAALLAAALLLLASAGAAAAEPVAPEPTGITVKITIAETGGQLKFIAPPTVAEGDALEIVNKTNPLKVGPFTFSLVRPGYLPKTKRAQANCFTPGHICWSIAEWQGVHGEGVPTINPAEAGLPGWDHAKAVQFFMTGLAPNGQPARPPMPAYHMNKADAEAVVAYLESLKK